MTLRMERPMVLQLREKIRCSRGRDSSNLNDQRNTTTAKSGGARNTILHPENERMASPRKGARMGVNKKIVRMSDMVRAISSPEKRSRTPAMVVMNTADAPTPAIKRAPYIISRLGEKAAAIPPMI